MARFMVYGPVYTRQGQHLASDARISNPAVIDLTEENSVSLSWDPMDEDAAKMYAARVEAQVKKETGHLVPAGKDPKSGNTIFNDQQKIDKLAADIRAKYKRGLKTVPPPKPVAREVDTNTEMAEGSRKVVGRAADRSPV